MSRLAAALLLLSLALTGCASEDTGDGGSKNDNGFSDADTSKFAPAVKTRIDGLVAAKDCDTLQAQFDIADGNRNVELMSYINDGMESADCF